MEVVDNSPGQDNQQPAQKPRRHQVATACVRCRRRKVRCNGRFPCETCLRLRLACQEPEVKRNPSRASLEQRIDQLEALASEAGIDIFSRPQSETSASRNRSISSASASSNVSAHQQPLRLDTSTEFLSPATTINDYEYPVLSASSGGFSPLNIPTIEVTASTRAESPVPLGYVFSGPSQGISTCHTPDLATPALSTGSSSIPPSPALIPPSHIDHPYYTQDYEFSPSGAALAFNQEQTLFSRRSSVAPMSEASSQAMVKGSIVSQDEAVMYQQGQLDDNHFSVDTLGQHALTSQDMSLSIPQDIFDAMDISAFESGPDRMSTQYLDDMSLTEPAVPLDQRHPNPFSSTYFQHVHPFFPFLDPASYPRYFDAVYGNHSFHQSLDIPMATARFQVYIVQAIGARILEHHNAGQQSSRESFFSAAVISYNSFQKLDTIYDVHSALLLLIYSLFCETAGIEPLTLKATITSSCVHLGLHKPRRDTGPHTDEDYRSHRTFLSAYILDRTISLALDEPFSLCDDNIEIEELVAQLDIHQQQHDSYPSARGANRNFHTLSVTAKLNRIISTICTVQNLTRPNAHGISRLTAPFLVTPTPPTLRAWRHEILQTLHTLSTEFCDTKSTSQPASVNEVLELLTNEGTLLLLHPSSGTLDETERCVAQSTARRSVSIYRRLQGSKALVPCVHLARGVYLCGMVLQSASTGAGYVKTKEGGVSGLRGRSTRRLTASGMPEDSDVVLCRDILRWFGEEGVSIAETFQEALGKSMA